MCISHRSLQFNYIEYDLIKIVFMLNTRKQSQACTLKIFQPCERCISKFSKANMETSTNASDLPFHIGLRKLWYAYPCHYRHGMISSPPSHLSWTISQISWHPKQSKNRAPPSQTAPVLTPGNTTTSNGRHPSLWIFWVSPVSINVSPS